MIPAKDVDAESLRRDCEIYVTAKAHVLFDRTFYAALLLVSPFALISLLEATAQEHWLARVAVWVFFAGGVTMLGYMFLNRWRAGFFVLAADAKDVYFEAPRDRFVKVDWRHCRAVRELARGGGKQGMGIGFEFEDYPGASWRSPTNAQLHDGEPGPVVVAPKNRGRARAIEALETLRQGR